jgi:hypothetical protein
LFDKNDLDALVGYAQRLVDDPDLRTRMGQSARQIVENCFTTAPVRRLERIDNLLIEGKPVTASNLEAVWLGTRRQ